MQQLEALRKRIESTESLLSVTRTMKTLAAVNIRHYERAVESLAVYSETIELGLQIVLRTWHDRIALAEHTLSDTLGAIIFGSEQGLAGQFNERIAAYALDRMRPLKADPRKRRVLVLGTRVIGHLEDGGQPVAEAAPVPSSLAGITSAVHEVLLEVETWRAVHDIDQILLFYNTPAAGASYEPVMQWLVPVDPAWLARLQSRPWDSRVLPTFFMDGERLLSALVRQHLFVSLYRAFAESLASENAARLAAMQAAEQNIEDRLGVLRTQHHHFRQSSITEELLDIAAGFEALTGRR